MRSANGGTSPAPDKFRPSLVLPGFLVMIGVIGFTLTMLGQASGASPAAAKTVTGSRGGCSVRLAENTAKTEVTATIVSGCTGSDYYLTSWTAQSTTYRTSLPQSLYRETNHAPWTIALPYDIGKCDWQVDFAELSAPPPSRPTYHRFIAGFLDGTVCPAPTTTTTTPVSTSTSTTTTLVKPPVSTTKVAPTTSTTVARAATTTTTVAPYIGATSSTRGAGTAPGSGDPTTPASSQGTLAFTGFVVTTLVFAGIALIGFGISVLRISRGRPPADL